MRFIFSLTFVLALVLSCTDDDDTNTLPPVVEEEAEEIPVDTTSTNKSVTFFNRDLVMDSYVLVNDAAANRVFLMDKEANILHEWPLNGNRLGNDAFLLPDGRLLIMLEVEDPQIGLGGFGGKIQLLDRDGNIDWEYEYSSNTHIAHHDAEMLPNGNILFQTWERKTKEEAIAAGSKLDTTLVVDALLEVNPITNDIVWKWSSWDHLIQDHDQLQNNFGMISENPQLIDLNYVEEESGDIMHANGISYDAEKDVIYLSVNFYSEVWVIDHSTTIAEAAASTGGNGGKGGDLLYRFGNPEAYQNMNGVRLFDHNHFPNLLSGTDTGKMLIYSNGFTSEQSTVYELQLPDTFVLLPNTNNEPSIVWSFTDTDLFAPRVSGAVRLPNGNTLIAEGDFGLWEVSNDKEILWKYEKNGFYWRGYHYDKNAEAVMNLNLGI